MKVADQQELLSSYEQVLEHNLEVMRMSHNEGMHEQTVLLLLKMNRDEDAYNFIKWLAAIDPDGNYDWGMIPESTKGGEWLYLEGQNRFEDLFKVGSRKQHLFPMNYLVALALIKFRILAEYQKRKMEFEELEKTLLGTKYEFFVTHEPIIHVFKLNLFGYCTKVFEEQEKHLENYLDLNDKRNPVLLKALVNPKPLMAQKFPIWTGTDGSPNEARYVMWGCLTLFQRTPGAIDKVAARFDGAVSYDPTFI